MTEPLEGHLLRQNEPTFWHRIRARPVIELVPERGAFMVVDIGAGAGHLAAILHRQRPDATYHFFEPLETVASQLEADHGADARRSGPQDVGHADLVTLLDVVEHVEDDRALLAGVIEATAPGTLFVVTAPALPMLWSWWDEQLGHHRRYTRRRLAQAVVGSPVELLEVSYLFPEMVLPALVRQRVGRRASRPQTGDADFPTFPGPIDRTLEVLGSMTYRSRAWWPFGTSVLLVARRAG